jgi:sulfoxide reductase heme-binding subunit YedZ
LLAAALFVFLGAGSVIITGFLTDGEYRRELGVWFGIFAITHTIIILDGWVLWDFYQFMGYQYIPAIDQTVRMESGFGMANVLGLLAVLIALPMMATLTDLAIRALGASA